MHGELYHEGIKGQKWGVRRFQNEDRTWTEEGKIRYGRDGSHGHKIERATTFVKDKGTRVASRFTKSKLQPIRNVGNDIDLLARTPDWVYKKATGQKTDSDTSRRLAGKAGMFAGSYAAHKIYSQFGHYGEALTRNLILNAFGENQRVADFVTSRSFEMGQKYVGDALAQAIGGYAGQKAGEKIYDAVSDRKKKR